MCSKLTGRRRDVGQCLELRRRKGLQIFRIAEQEQRNEKVQLVGHEHRRLNQVGWERSQGEISARETLRWRCGTFRLNAGVPGGSKCYAAETASPKRLQGGFMKGFFAAVSLATLL